MTLALLSLVLLGVSAHCPNSCSGHGTCTGVARCSCFTGWSGGDCSLRACPLGPAWADIAVAVDTAHSLVACSNRGVCDTRLGACVCYPGFEGPACNRLSCVGGCSGQGECVTMRRHAQALDAGSLPLASPYTNVRSPYPYVSNWDAEMIQGCSCDPGFAGQRCSERVCPAGDDPMTGGQVDEVQLLRCDIDPADPAYSGLQFTLEFRGAITRPFAPSTSAFDLQALLQALPTIHSARVAYSSGATFCDGSYAQASGLHPLRQPASSNVISVTFLTEHGPLPRLTVRDAAAQPLYGPRDNAVVVAAQGESLAATAPGATPGSIAVLFHPSRSGTKESLPCSGRGRCSAATGACACFTGFGPSNGQGAKGSLGDCGFPYLPITACPGSGGKECSGSGVCSGYPSYQCTCTDGWGGGDCSQRTCPSGAAWFDYPTAPNTAHAPAVCSARGTCDAATGLCACDPNFSGAACERMACPSSSSTAPCSGHGQCLSQAALAAASATAGGDPQPYVTYGANPALPATWDAGKVRGCLCDPGYGGPDCSALLCPTGNDITLLEANPAALDAQQWLGCAALPGLADPTLPPPTITLTFMGQSTAPLPVSASAAAVQAALQALPAIGGSIGVAYDPLAQYPTLCTSASPPQAITFSFRTAHGALPPLRVALAGRDPVLGTFSTGLGWAPSQLQFTGGSAAAGYLGSAAQPSTQLVYSATPAGFPASGLGALTVRAGQSGSEVCSGRGLCDSASGKCQCFLGYGASNNDRKAGPVENCGWRQDVQAVYVPQQQLAQKGLLK